MIMTVILLVADFYFIINHTLKAIFHKSKTFLKKIEYFSIQSITSNIYSFKNAIESIIKVRLNVSLFEIRIL